MSDQVCIDIIDTGPWAATMHYPMTVGAPDAGLHIMCEKPLALNAKQAKELFFGRIWYALCTFGDKIEFFE